MVGDVYVLHRSAIDAYEVVMVAFQPLGELVAGEALGSMMRREHPGLLEHG